MRCAKLGTGWPTRVGLCATFATLFFGAARRCARGFARAADFFAGGGDFAATGAVLTDSSSARSATAAGGRFFATGRAR